MRASTTLTRKGLYCYSYVLLLVAHLYFDSATCNIFYSINMTEVALDSFPILSNSTHIWPVVHFTDKDMLIISIFAIAIGMALAFLGRKLFKATLFIVGFITIGGATYYIMQSIAIHTSSVHFSKVESIAIPLAVGFVGGCVVIGLIKLGFFLAGAAVGAVLSFMLISVVGSHFGPHAFWIRIAIVAFLMIVCGAITVYQEKRLIILITSLGGAYLTFAGIDHFVKSGYVQAMHSLLINDQNILPSANGKLLGMLGGTIGLAVFGFIFQFFTNRKKEVSGWEENQYLLRGKVNY